MGIKQTVLETRLKKVLAWNTIKIKNGITYLFPQTIIRNFYMSDSFCFKDKNSHENVFFVVFELLLMSRTNSKSWKVKIVREIQIYSICRIDNNVEHLSKMVKKIIFSSVFVVCQVICHIYGSFVQKCVSFCGSTLWYHYEYLRYLKKCSILIFDVWLGISCKTTSRTKIGTKSNLIWKILFS